MTSIDLNERRLLLVARALFEDVDSLPALVAAHPPPGRASRGV